MIHSQINIVAGGRTVSPGHTCVLTSSRTPWMGFLTEYQQISGPPIARFHLPVPHLALITRGRPEAKWRAGGVHHRSQWNPGTIVYLTSGYELTSVEWSEPYERLVIEIDVTRLTHLLRDHRDTPHLNLADHIIAEDAQVSAILRTMHAEIMAGCPAGALYGQSLSLSLTAYLSGRFGTPLQSRRARTGGLRTKELSRVINYMHEHLSDDLALSDLAEVNDLSVYQFCRSFRQATGVTPYQHLIRMRIDRAKVLVAKRTSSMTEIALTLGFSSSSHFSETFHRLTGVSPRDFQRRCRSDTSFLPSATFR